MSYSKFEQIDYDKLLDSSDESDGEASTTRVDDTARSSLPKEPGVGAHGKQRTDDLGLRTDQRRRRKKKPAAAGSQPAAVPATAAQMHASSTEAVSSMIAQDAAGQFMGNEFSSIAQFNAIAVRWPELKKDKNMLTTHFLHALKKGAKFMLELLWKCLDEAYRSTPRPWHFHQIKCSGEQKYLVDFAVDLGQVPLIPVLIADGRANLSEKALHSLSAAHTVLRAWLQEQEEDENSEFDGYVCCNVRDGCHLILGCEYELVSQAEIGFEPPPSNFQIRRACECDQQYFKALRGLFIEAIKRARPAMSNAATHLETLRLLIRYFSMYCSVRSLPLSPSRQHGPDWLFRLGARRSSFARSSRSFSCAQIARRV